MFIKIYAVPGSYSRFMLFSGIQSSSPSLPVGSILFSYFQIIQSRLLYLSIQIEVYAIHVEHTQIHLCISVWFTGTKTIDIWEYRPTRREALDIYCVILFGPI